jgi:hypothetical protein
MATYKDGIQITADGAVFITGVAAGAVIPATAIPISGTAIPGGKFVAAADRGLYVRFV